MSLHKIPSAEEQKQIDLQKQAMLVNTRFQLSQTFLNTLLGRPDVDLNDAKALGNLVGLSLDLTDALLAENGITGQKEKE